MEAAVAAGVYIPHLCYHREFKPHGSCKRVHGARERPDRRRVHAPAQAGHRRRERHPRAQREPPHADRDAVRRGQPLLPVLREERQLPAAGRRLRPRHAVDRPRPLLPEPAESTPRTRTAARPQPLHPLRAAACGPAAEVDGKNVFGSPAAASSKHLIVNAESGGSRDTDVAVDRRGGRRSVRSARSSGSASASRCRSASGATTSSRSRAGEGRCAARGARRRRDDGRMTASSKVATTLAGRLLRLPHVAARHRRAALRARCSWSSSTARRSTDIKHCGPCDIGLIEGGVLQRGERARAARVPRATARCWWRSAPARSTAACRRMRNHLDLGDCLQEVYLTEPGIAKRGCIPNDPELPLPLDKVRPLPRGGEGRLLPARLPAAGRRDLGRPDRPLAGTRAAAAATSSSSTTEAAPAMHSRPRNRAHADRHAPRRDRARVPRVEGHGKVTILLDDGQPRRSRRACTSSSSAASSSFVQGRPYWEVPVLVQRLCGICPVSHHLAAAKAIDMIVGATRLTPTAEKMRRLMHYGQILQSHALHFFHLASPDLLFGFDAPIGEAQHRRRAAAHPDLARQGVLLRKYGQEVIRVDRGQARPRHRRDPGRRQQAPHRRGARRAARRRLPKMIDWSPEAVELVKRLHAANVGTATTASARSARTTCRWSRADGALDLYDGDLRARDDAGRVIFDHVDYEQLLGPDRRGGEALVVHEVPVPSRRSAPSDGWYRVGPLARVNNCDSIPTPARRGRAPRVRRRSAAAADARDPRLPLGADDRDAARRRGDQGAARRPRPARRRSGRDGERRRCAAWA